MRQLTIFLVLIGIFSLGLWGQYERSPETFILSFSHHAYQVLMLFVLEGEWTHIDDLPWQLEIVRTIAPLATIAGVVFALIQDSWFGVLNFFIRYRSNHVVVAGLGSKSWQFIQSARDEYKIVVVERDPDNPYISRARDMGVDVLVGDIFADGMLGQAGLASARHLVTFTGNDGFNVDLTIKARNFVREQGNGNPLRIHLHLNDSRIAQSLEDYPKFFADHRAAQVNFFSVYDLNARILLARYSPERFAEVFGQEQVHIALYRFGRLAEHILIEALRIGHYANHKPLRFTIFDENASAMKDDLLSEFPQLADTCEIDFIDIRLGHSREYDRLENELLSSITEHVVCGPTDEENLQISLTLRSMLLKRVSANAPIMVRMRQTTGLAQLLESNYGGPEIPDGIFPFGMLDEVLHHDNVLSDGMDALARAMHEDYLRGRAELEVDKRLYTSLNAWENLPEPVRKSNRLQADHLATKLRAVSCSVRPGKSSGFEFSEDEAELLAHMEHDRWRFNKTFDGWKAGPSRIEGAKVNPFAVSWQEMDEAERAKERESIRSLPQMLSEQLGQNIQRDLLIGVTGHRPHKLDMNDRKVHDSIRAQLREIVDANPGHRFVIVSPLAEGADRLVAQIGMKEFDMELQVPLPLPYELYATDFSSDESIEEFRRMVGESEAYFELPLKFGSIEELAIGVGAETNEARNQQYALVGAYLVEHCDELIAVYDGEPAAGEGGTAQVVAWRSDGAVPACYQNPLQFFRRPEMRPPRVVTP